jgi:hypothetical protein
MEDIVGLHFLQKRLHAFWLAQIQVLQPQTRFRRLGLDPPGIDRAQ